ncbi:hypothetical protein [Streptomyces tropicalis]|uniref:Secreted protein n=1 Tax=Streptomyces tropicalis TaxID=3034234 RepID=A0ABT6AEB2_9ACTN|nr:hypothetical protein [Streptomyces tropicalis]MDF3302989.1 hypothetical protein [Streptomyces tropicalis]
MTPPPARAATASGLAALATLALLTAAACTAGGAGSARTAPSDGPGTKASADPGPALTVAQAEAALITDEDLGAAWAPTQGAASWRDGLLKAQAGTPACQRLLDALYADEVLGPPTGSYAIAGFDDGDDSAQLRYQVLAHRPADVDRSLAWLKTLPRTCSRFTAATTRAGTQSVEVADLPLPAVGDARQGLRVTLTGMSAYGDPTVLTLDVAAVRVGDDAITLSDGALGNVPEDATVQAVKAGSQRLADVRHQARLQA